MPNDITVLEEIEEQDLVQVNGGTAIVAPIRSASTRYKLVAIGW